MARGERAKARPADDPHADLVRIRGQVHEREQLDRLTAECGGHVDPSTNTSPYTCEDHEAATDATADAMRAGAPLIPGAVLRWRMASRADFLRRIPHPSAPGDQAYEVLATKVARQVNLQVTINSACTTRCSPQSGRRCRRRARNARGRIDGFDRPAPLSGAAPSRRPRPRRVLNGSGTPRRGAFIARNRWVSRAWLMRSAGHRPTAAAAPRPVRRRRAGRGARAASARAPVP